MTDKLSPHFSLNELTKTDSGYDNTPSNAIVDNLYKLAEKLEKVREILGNAKIKVESAYRSPDVNAYVKGSKTSDHMSGLACDFKHDHLSPSECVRILMESSLRYDQLIVEPSWVHIGIGKRMRQETLIKNGDKYDKFTG